MLKCPQNSLWANSQVSAFSGTISLMSEDFETGIADKKHFDCITNEVHNCVRTITFLNI